MSNRKPPHRPVDPAEIAQEGDLIRSMTGFFDPDWYLARYQDVAAANLDPMQHFLRHGINERRDPNRFFDSAWYAEHYPDVTACALHPLLHYLQFGAAELRNPNPRFDAVYYVDQHPEAAPNPLVHHLRVGLALGYLTEKQIDIQDYLPSARPVPPLPRKVVADVIIPVYRGTAETMTCISSVLADRRQPLGRVIVVEDRSPEPKLVKWLLKLAAEDQIQLIRNRDNLGFVRSVNLGMEAAGDNDVVLLNSDTEVSKNWLRRLAAQAYVQPRIGTVSPFSNNATICGYPDNQGGPIALGQTVAQLDRVCQAVNAGRFVEVPTTVGFCMYIRREALREVGPFDADRFTVGYGEENDFCLRASDLGWRHRLACDSFVYHRGSVSFGDKAAALTRRAMKLILARHPGYARSIAQHVSLGAVDPYRFAVTAGLFRQSRLPVILMISHNLGGGIRRHIDDLTERYRDAAHMLLLEATDRGAALSVPSLPDHPVLTLSADRIDDLIAVLQSMDVARVHIHHLVAMDMDIRRLIRRLGVPFDVTVHDYHAICPQMNLLPRPDRLYCGEPDAAGCNACIAACPAHGARDILSWRAERKWQFVEAARVLCPSIDVLSRLRRYGLAANAVLAPHEPVAATAWPLHRVARPSGAPLRIAVLGVLADHKGARTVAAVAEATDPAVVEIHLIGYPEHNFSKPALKRLKTTGEYAEAELPGLIEQVAPDVIWFPAAWPETFSYTLSAAIASGRPIAAARIGAFDERLVGRPLTWLADPSSAPGVWIKLFEDVRKALGGEPSTTAPPLRPRIDDFYATEYLQPFRTRLKLPVKAPLVRPRGARARPIVAVVPERFDGGYPTPCAFIRLLQPLDHPAIAREFEVLVTDADAVLDYEADVIVSQRYAMPDLEAADALAAHAKRTGARLLFDLDDDLLNIPRGHPDAPLLRPQAKVVRRMLDHADVVWLSTQGLAERLSPIRPDAMVVENRLDERIWLRPPQPIQDEPLRILCMGTSTHNRDFAIIEPALVRLKDEFGDRVVIDVLGMTTQSEFAAGINRIGPSPHASRSYPGFVNWLASAQPGWHVGLAPLLESAFNRCKSSIKAMDYAALGMAVLASDMPVYRGSIADGPAGQLVANDHRAWYAALTWLLRNPRERRSMAERASGAFRAQATLASQASHRRDALMQLLLGRKDATAA